MPTKLFYLLVLTTVFAFASSIKSNKATCLSDCNQNSKGLNPNSMKVISSTRGGSLKMEESKVIQKTSTSESESMTPLKPSTTKILTLFGLWYLFTIGSSSAMTSASKSLPLPWLGTSMRLWVGSIFIFGLWKSGLRPMPNINKDTVKSVIPVAFMSTLTLLFTGMAYAAGSLPFVSIVKSAEPVTMALLNAIIFRKLLPFPVYASLIPVVAGVGLASLKELNFSLASLIYSMIVNLTSSLRSIMAKTLTNTGLSPQAMTGLMSMLGASMITPVGILLESDKLAKLVQAAAEDAAVANSIKRFLILNVASGIALYLFYEGSFMCLSAVGPLSHSIGNTIGRVVVIIAGVLIYKTQMTPLNILGAAFAVGGVFLYSYMQNHYASKVSVSPLKKEKEVTMQKPQKGGKAKV